MVFVPVTHEQTLAYDVLKWHRLADLAPRASAGAEVTCGGYKARYLDVLVWKLL